MPPTKKSDKWLISPKTQRLIKVGGPAYEALTSSQKANAKKATKKEKLKKPIKKSTSLTTKGKRVMSLMMVASRDGNFSSGEKYRWKVSSEEDIKTRMIELATKGWVVKAAASHGLPEKLWKTKKLSIDDLSDWVCGYDTVKKYKEVYETYKVKIALKPLKSEIEHSKASFGGKLKKEYESPEFSGEEASSEEEAPPPSKKVTRKIPTKRSIKK